MPVVLGAMSERTTSKAFSSPRSSPSSTVWMSAQSTRAPGIGWGRGSRSIPTTAPSGPTTLSAYCLLELVDRARRESGAARLPEEGVVTMARIAELGHSLLGTLGGFRASRDGVDPAKPALPPATRHDPS